MTLILKRSFAAALLLTALGACISEMPRFPFEPGPTAFQPAFIQVNAVAPGQVRSNRAKYRDAGLKPGRVADADVEVRALLGRDGMTTVEASTGSFDEGPALVRIDKVQLQLPGSTVATYNERPQSRTWSRVVPSLVMGDLVQVMMHLRYSGASAPKIVTITVPVGRRPDLVLSSITAPQRTNLGSPTTIVATVMERSGQVGARANCLLSVDGIAVDQATRIWVDAGDVVSCEFIYFFNVVGQHNVSVSLTGVVPGDDDLTNNSAGTSVNVVAPVPLAQGDISAFEEVHTYTFVSERTGTNATTETSVRSTAMSQVAFSGKSPGAVGSIDGIRARVSVDGQEISATDLPVFSRFETDDGQAHQLCVTYRLNGEQARGCVKTPRGGEPLGEFMYRHTTGTVTFYGQTVFCHTQGCETYTTPPTTDVTGTGENYGIGSSSQLRLELTFTDAAGTEHVVDRTVSFQDQSATVNFTRNFGCFSGTCMRDSQQGSMWSTRLIWPEVLP